MLENVYKSRQNCLNFKLCKTNVRFDLREVFYEYFITNALIVMYWPGRPKFPGFYELLGESRERSSRSRSLEI